MGSPDFLEFWLVWSPTGTTPPRHRHRSEVAARLEVERLARLRPGWQFFVLHTVAMAEITELEWSEARSADYFAALAPEAMDGDLLAPLREQTPAPGPYKSPEQEPPPEPSDPMRSYTEEDMPF